MDHPDVRRLAERQDGLVARWQLITEAQLTKDAAEHALRGLRRPFPGVALTGWAPITQQQTWRAAVLTAPDTVLARTSSAASWELRRERPWFVTVARPGRRGREQYGRLLVSYSTTLAEDTVLRGGLPVTSPARTLLDLWPEVPGRARSKLLREALRLQVLTATDVLAVTHRHGKRRGARALAAETTARMRLPFDRCRSDAEAFGLVVLDDAGIEIPAVNERFAGEEADFCWPGRKDIIELDGPQWHRFKEEDARKTAIWTAAGYRVRRLGTEQLFTEPASLLRLVA